MGGQDPARIGAGIVAEIMNDKVIWDHKVYRNRPRLAENEGPVREFRRWALTTSASRGMARILVPDAGPGDQPRTGRRA
jgi:3-Ketosteroid 9alpha-hydroxylase C-terminal domain